MTSWMTTYLTALAIIAVLALPIRAAAQQMRNPAYPYTLIDLGTFGGPQSYLNLPAMPINAHGIALGTADTTISDPDYPNFNPSMVGFPDPDIVHAFAWHRGVLTALGALPGNNTSAIFELNWLNDAGSVGGRGDLPGSQAHHAFLRKHGVMTDLGVPAGDTCDTSYEGNATDQVVGAAGICGGTAPHAFLWAKGTIYDVTTLVAPSDLHVEEGNYINNAGEIAGIGVFPIGDQHVVLLIPRDLAAREGLTSNAPAPGTTGPATGTRQTPASCALVRPWHAHMADRYHAPCRRA